MIALIKAHIRKKVPIAVRFATEIKFQLSKRKIRRILRERQGICLDLGAGDRTGHGEWLTIDMTRNCDIFWDLRKGIPFPDESIKKIYSSHFFEHLTFEESQEFLEECKRALIPGGQFSICVPNARIYVEAYAQGRSLDPKVFFAYKAAYNRTTRIDYINYMAYMGGQHKYMFDEENLVFILESKGFHKVRLRQFDPSLDLMERHFESIYAEAEK